MNRNKKICRIVTNIYLPHYDCKTTSYIRSSVELPRQCSAFDCRSIKFICEVTTVFSYSLPLNIFQPTDNAGLPARP